LNIAIANDVYIGYTNRPSLSQRTTTTKKEDEKEEKEEEKKKKKKKTMSNSPAPYGRGKNARLSR
jgi:hypothetical protein